MNLLGIDTSTAASAACVLRADGEAFEVEPPAERLTGGPGHASELLPAVAGCLERAGLDWDVLDAIGVGIGPGTFTGLRIGVATARALADAHGAELRPVSSLMALAQGARGEGAGTVLALIDARRGELFSALYMEAEELWTPAAMTPETLAERIAADGIAPLAVGDGAVRFRKVLEAAGATVPPDSSQAHVVKGIAVCRVAAAVAPVPVEAVLPDYIRPPDAKPRHSD